MILDTTFIIDLLRKDPASVEKAASLQRSGEPVLATAVSVFEVWQGAVDLKDVEKRRKIESLLSSIGLLPLDCDCAKEAGRVHDECYRRGVPIDPEDSMIAGIALTHGQAVLTRNVKHFRQVRGLSVETY